MLNETETKIHRYARRCADVGKRSDAQLCRALVKIERDKIYRKMGRESLIDYIASELGIDSTFTFQLKSVVMAAIRLAPLARALETGRLRAGHASRILSKLADENVNEWVGFAASHTFAEVVEKVATSGPSKTTRETKEKIAGNQTRISLVVDDRLLVLIERAQALLAQRGLPSNVADSMEEVYSEYLDRRDPVERAKRAKHRQIKSSKGPEATTRPSNKIPVVRTKSRVPLVAAEKHEVMARTKGRCTENRHVHVHHIKPVSEGGSNDPSNLTLLCHVHHDFVHRLSFPGLETAWSFADHPGVVMRG